MSRDLFLSWPYQGGNQKEGGAISDTSSPPTPQNLHEPSSTSLQFAPSVPHSPLPSPDLEKSQHTGPESRTHTWEPLSHHKHPPSLTLSLPVFAYAVLSGWNTFPTKSDLVFTSQLTHHFL